jgi:P27 family predicted phage terminase small subunit
MGEWGCFSGEEIGVTTACRSRAKTREIKIAILGIKRMRGRKPKPLTQHLAEGDPSHLGKARLQEKLAAEPKPTRGLPPFPHHLSGRARTAWNFWREELEAIGLDHRSDAAMLEGACVFYARAVEADLLLQRHGLMMEQPIFNQKGEHIGTKSKSHPALAVSNSSWRPVRAFCSEFGLSPVSRTRLTLEKPDTSEAELMAILAGPREKKPDVQ